MRENLGTINFALVPETRKPVQTVTWHITNRVIVYLFPKKIKGSFAVLQKLIKDPYVQEDIYYLKYRLDNICVMVTNARLQRMNFSNQFDYIINANTNEVFPAFVTMIYFSWSKFLFKKSTTGDIGVNVPFKNQQIINSLPPPQPPYTCNTFLWDNLWRTSTSTSTSIRQNARFIFRTSKQSSFYIFGVLVDSRGW